MQDGIYINSFMCPLKTLPHIPNKTLKKKNPRKHEFHAFSWFPTNPPMHIHRNNRLTSASLNTYELILYSAHSLLCTGPSIPVHVISIHPPRLANIPRKVRRLNNSCRVLSSLSHCDLGSFQLWQHGVRGNLTKNDTQLSASTLFAPSLKDTRLSVLYMLVFLCAGFVCRLRVCVCFCVRVTCFSRVGRRSRPTTCDVYVEDVH